MWKTIVLTILFSLSGLVCLLNPSGPNTDDSLYSKNIIVVDSSNFDEIVHGSDTVAVIEFYNPDCPVCRQTKDTVESLAVAFESQALIGKINTAENNTLIKKYNVNTLPTFIIFLNGRAVFRQSGVITYDTLSQHLYTAIRNSIYPDGVVALDSANFTKMVLSNNIVSMIEFFSYYCHYCTAMDSIVNELATEFNKKALIGQVNVDTNRNDSLKSRYNIHGIPAFIFFKNGVEVSRKVGTTPYDSLAARIQALLRDP